MLAFSVSISSTHIRNFHVIHKFETCTIYNLINTSQCVTKHTKWHLWPWAMTIFCSYQKPFVKYIFSHFLNFKFLCKKISKLVWLGGMHWPPWNDITVLQNLFPSCQISFYKTYSERERQIRTFYSLRIYNTALTSQLYKIFANTPHSS